MEITKNITRSNIKTDRFIYPILHIITLSFQKIKSGNFFVFLIGLILFYSCAPSGHTPSKKHKNLSYIYNDSEAFLHPEYQIYNFSDDSSEVFYKIPYKDLLIRDLGGDFEKYAVVEIHYRLYESMSIASMVDSGTVYNKIIIDENKTTGFYSFKVKSPSLNVSYLRVQFKDLFSERKRRDYLEVNKTRSVHRQSFLITDKNTKEAIFGNELLIHKTYLLESPLFRKHELFIQEQDLINTIPNLPFSKQRTSELQFSSDTTYKAVEYKISPLEKRLYFLTFDTSKIKGVALYTYDSLPNYIHTPRQMLEPLSYLVSPKEYQALLTDPEPKHTLDRFWLKMGENRRHAKEMIKVYYHRVAVANKYYSSYKKGWMTDRGMIYVIYGEPTSIYKSQTLERWIYGTEESDESLLFDFKIERNPFTDNNYELIRDEEYKKSWFQAVDSWRNGRIYSIAR